MRSIEARFKKVESEHPDWSSYVCFANAIYGQGFCKDKIHRHLNKLVEKDDYHKSEKKEILRFLVAHSDTLRGTENEVKNDTFGVLQNQHE